MSLKTRHVLAAGLTAGALALGACSSEGGAQNEADPTNVGPEMDVALITHAVPGDTFWDIVRKGAEAAAAKDNVNLLYSSDPEAGKQAQLVEAAIDQDVDGIVLTLAKPEAMASAVRHATREEIPVVSINAGETESARLGAVAHFGQNESVAGQAAGAKLNELGYQHAVCVNQHGESVSRSGKRVMVTNGSCISRRVSCAPLAHHRRRRPVGARRGNAPCRWSLRTCRHGLPDKLYRC